ncbi:MAG: zf-HC2 domain-containing protein [Paenibacillaceae bacterium]
MNCKQANPLIHEYLDAALEGPDLTELKQHLLDCPACREFLSSLEQADACLRVVPQPTISDGFTERIMSALPKQSRATVFKRWIKRHPAVSVAAVFVMVMMSSFLSLWDNEHDLMVQGNDLENVVIQGDLVIIPEGQTVNGDLLVENGKLQVFGSIQGNLVVVDGSIFTASTANIAGQVTSVNETIDHFWYKVKEFMSGFSR